MATPFELLDGWLAERLDDEPIAWLRGKVQAAKDQGPLPAFFLAFSTIGRKLGRADLALSGADLGRAVESRRGWQPGSWNVSQAARTLLLLALPDRGAAACRTAVDQLCEDADLGELVATYQA